MQVSLSLSLHTGHTKHFHFFGVNMNRDDIRAFYLVDVPGLGYAEVDEGKRTSLCTHIHVYTHIYICHLKYTKNNMIIRQNR